MVARRALRNIIVAAVLLALARLTHTCLAASGRAGGTAEGASINSSELVSAAAADQKPGVLEKAGSSNGASGVPWETAPPRADLVTVSAPDAEGNATVTGAAGAVKPGSAVLIANLNAQNLIVVGADARGAFSARLYAPPGSSLLIRHDSTRERLNLFWQRAQPGQPLGDFSYINPLPATIIQVGPPTPSSRASQAFHSVSRLWMEDDRSWAGVWFSGTLSVVNGGGSGPGLPVSRGQQVRLTGRVRFTSAALNCSGALTYTPRLHLHLIWLFAPNGHEYGRGTWFSGYLFTPTGLPIELGESPGSRPVISASPYPLTCISRGAADGQVDVTFTIPNDLPDGMYQLAAHIERGGVPLAHDVPTAPVWFNFDPILPMVHIRIGSSFTPRLACILLGDVPSNGHRGVQAREDVGYTAPSMRTITPPHTVVVPRLDERSGQPIAYRLEPGCIWLSSNDRRLPSAPYVPIRLPSGSLQVRITRPDGRSDTLGPAPIRQSYGATPTLPSGDPVDFGSGHLCDLYHLTTLDERFSYSFPLYGHYVIAVSGNVQDIYGDTYSLAGTYDVYVARTLDLDPAQLPTMPYKQGDAFAPGLHVFPPVPADVTIKLVQMRNSNASQATTRTITGKANRFGYFQPPLGTETRMIAAGEFRVDYTAVYTAPDGTLWVGAMTWGNVIEGPSPQIEAHGRRGMDYEQGPIDDMPAWFEVFRLPQQKVGIENYYPYFSGDVHWGNEDRSPGDSIHSIISIKDLTGAREVIYNLMRANYPRNTNGFRWPPMDTSLSGLNQRIAIGEAPLFISTSTGNDPAVFPEEIDQLSYWYASSERPDVHVREIISDDRIGTAYWRFNDTYGYQIGEPADGDHPGDIKWEFGGAVLRVPSRGIYEYAIYSSLWVLLPHGDPVGARVTPPFQDATGASINGGPIMKLRGQDIDMLFLPKGVRPGDVLELGDVIAFCGHVGPPLDSSVAVTITAPSGAVHSRSWHANKIGWLYDPTFDFGADQVGRWTVDVRVLHDRPYVGNGVTPRSHNTGTVLGTDGRYEFYVVERGAARLPITAPGPGFLAWVAGTPNNWDRIRPVTVRGIAPAGTTSVRYTIHDKGVVIAQGSATPDTGSTFTLTYDARTLHNDFPFVSLTAHEGQWEGLADEVSIDILALQGSRPMANTVTLIGEEVFVGSDQRPRLYLPALLKTR